MTETRFAAACRFLRHTVDGSAEDGPIVALCEHPIRSGFRCVGPFLDETPTDCGLWEPEQPRIHGITMGPR